MDFAGPLHSLLYGRTQKVKSIPQWRPCMKGTLASAISGGQWTQTRRASVPRWQIEDLRCQLCLAAPGTLEHRHECARTRPPEGWPPDPPKAELALRQIGQVRANTLRTRGLLVMRLPSPCHSADGWFKWLVAPGPESDELYTWYLDGSMHDGTYTEYRAVGFGIVVVAPDRSLAAYGYGVPPCWCKTAAAAEAWALHIALKESAFPPKLRTDCQCLLSTAREGAAQATGPSRPLARIWGLIATSLDGHTEGLTERGLLVWMPAHQPLSAISNAKLSNGKLLSGVDWRANRLVDALAKSAATTVRAPSPLRCLLESGHIAAKHRAALLAVVTHTANNQKEPVQRPDGTWSTRTVRDAQQPPGHTRRQRKHPKPPAEPAQLAVAHGSSLVRDCTWREAHSGKRKRAASAARRWKRPALCSRADGRPFPRLCMGRSAAVHHSLPSPSDALCGRPRTVASHSLPVAQCYGAEPQGWSHLERQNTSQASNSGDKDVQGTLGTLGRSVSSVPLPDEDLLSLQRDGLKVVWQHRTAASNVAKTLAPVSGASQRARSGIHLGKAAEANADSLSVADQDLMFLHACGLKVVWP